MPRQSPSFSQANIMRAIKAVQSCGIAIRGVSTEPGKITVLFGEPGEDGGEANLWDDVLGSGD